MFLFCCSSIDERKKQKATKIKSTNVVCVCVCKTLAKDKISTTNIKKTARKIVNLISKRFIYFDRRGRCFVVEQFFFWLFVFYWKKKINKFDRFKYWIKYCKIFRFFFVGFWFRFILHICTQWQFVIWKRKKELLNENYPTN